MSDFTEDFVFMPRKSGNGMVAEGEWHGDEVTLFLSDQSQRDEEIALLEELHRSWAAWSRLLRKAIDKEHGDPGDFWIEAISAYSGEGYEGYFEIEFSAPDLFGDDIALAVGTLKDGITDVGLPG